MDLIAAFDRAVEGMDWDELVSTLQEVLKDIKDNAPTPPSPAPSLLPLAPVPVGLELNTCPQPALSKGGEAVCHLMAAPSMSQCVYSQGQYLPYQWPLEDVPTAASVGPPAVPALPHNVETGATIPDGFYLRPIGALNGKLVYAITAGTIAPPVNAAPLVNIYSPRKIKCESQRGEDRPYIKRPLNAFMLFAKEQRANIQAKIMTSECKFVSAALGQRWNSMTREEQAKYYGQAEKERLLHAQRHPGWSTRDNYGKKRKSVKKTVRRHRKYEVFTCKREEETGWMEAPHTQTSAMEASLAARTSVMETRETVPLCGKCHLPQGDEFSPISWLDVAPSMCQATLPLPPQTAPVQRIPENRCHPVMQHLKPLHLTAQPRLPSSPQCGIYTVGLLNTKK